VTSNEQKDSGNRSANVLQSVEFGMNEKSIIKETRNHYKALHPTEKPVRLLERLLLLTTKENDLVLDPFAGSFSTGEACFNLNRNCTSFEIDKEYFDLGFKRKTNLKQSSLSKEIYLTINSNDYIYKTNEQLKLF
jgi:site-specific DNA-methyltransferase (adenine-specific)